jgi:hypothetical protein
LCHISQPPRGECVPAAWERVPAAWERVPAAWERVPAIVWGLSLTVEGGGVYLSDVSSEGFANTTDHRVFCRLHFACFHFASFCTFHFASFCTFSLCFILQVCTFAGLHVCTLHVCRFARLHVWAKPRNLSTLRMFLGLA